MCCHIALTQLIIKASNLAAFHFPRSCYPPASSAGSPAPLCDQPQLLSPRNDPLSRTSRVHRLSHRDARPIPRSLQALKFQVDPAFRQRAYVTDDDIRSIPSFSDKTLIAIKAPSGTTLAVPYAKDDDQTPPSRRKYQIFLKSENGPVDIYLVSNSEEEMHASEHDAAEVHMTLGNIDHPPPFRIPQLFLPRTSPRPPLTLNWKCCTGPPHGRRGGQRGFLAVVAARGPAGLNSRLGGRWG